LRREYSRTTASGTTIIASGKATAAAARRIAAAESGCIGDVGKPPNAGTDVASKQPPAGGEDLGPA